MTDPADPKFPDLRYVRELAKVFRQYELDELEIEAGDQRILLRQSDIAPPVAAAAPQVVHVPAAAPPTARVPLDAPVVVASAEADFITSPFVGTFYRSARPDTPSFVEVGAVVRPGQTLCIVEAMKLMNEIEAEVSGTVIEVFAQNGKSVEFGQKLFRIKKA